MDTQDVFIPKEINNLERAENQPRTPGTPEQSINLGDIPDQEEKKDLLEKAPPCMKVREETHFKSTPKPILKIKNTFILIICLIVIFASLLYYLFKIGAFQLK